MTRKIKLLQNQLSQIEIAENARKARKKQSNKILKIKDILYVKDARSMTQDRQKLKDERQQQREETWEKRYLNALQGQKRKYPEWPLYRNCTTTKIKRKRK